MKSVINDPVKIQIGARGKKRGNDWIAVDLYDTSQIIDENWDLHCLPIEDNSVDCFVCNAVLEHVTDPALAVYEMFRTLKPGGQIWSEVPFMQYFHPTPGDYARWTVQGFELLFRDFIIISSGVSVMISHEVDKVMSDLSRTIGVNFRPELVDEIRNYFIQYQSGNNSPRLYSSIYLWGKKPENYAEEKYKYFSWLRSEYSKSNQLPYDSQLKLKSSQLLERMRIKAAKII